MGILSYWHCYKLYCITLHYYVIKWVFCHIGIVISYIALHYIIMLLNGYFVILALLYVHGHLYWPEAGCMGPSSGPTHGRCEHTHLIKYLIMTVDWNKTISPGSAIGSSPKLFCLAPIGD